MFIDGSFVFSYLAFHKHPQQLALYVLRYRNWPQALIYSPYLFQLPQLLRVDTPAVPEAPQLKKSLITKYSWADAKDKAKVYVDLPNASEISNDAITISHDKRSFTLIINTGTESQHLIVTDLSTDINDVTFKKMTKSVVVTLHKVAPTTWFDLREPELAYANRDY